MESISESYGETTGARGLRCRDPQRRWKIRRHVIQGSRIQEEVGALRDIPAKVQKEMGTVQDSRSGSPSQAEKEEVDSRSMYVDNVDYHVLLRKSRRPFVPAAPFYPAFGYGRVPRFRRPWRKIPRVGLAWVTGQHCCPAQQAQWVQEIQGPRDLVLRSAAVEHRRHRRLVLHGIPQTLRRLHQSPVVKGARDLSQLQDAREDRFGREDQPKWDFGRDDFEKDYNRRIHRARPCLLPAPVQREVLLIVREQGKVSARLSQKIRDRVQKWYQDEGMLLHRVDLLEDVDARAKFVDSVGKVVIRSDSFAKHPTYLKGFSLIATMHKTLILAAKSMRVDQAAVKCAKEAEVALVAQLCLAAEKIEKLEYGLVVLKRFDIFAPTSLQLEITHEEVAHLNARLSATQAMLEAVKKEDEELIFMHAEVSRLKEIANKLESKEVDLQGMLSASENLRKELDELQAARNGLVEENMQLKNEKTGHEVALASFELLEFSFEATFGGVAEGQAVQEGTIEDELMDALAASSGAATEGLASFCLHLHLGIFFFSFLFSCA
ncbi:protein TOC75-3 [Pyrus ussuriensis x Pyrus communis]|uniref:Protein TOC75-3 n=1 Tax=Pyrus ussuriensis x Pyrus communis TaxID=2448454 RepID=A0A5N5IA00_9ROSA|nr:protein TOC75-3 [Pyrus ussuriensis x Pyrus communis]